MRSIFALALLLFAAPTQAVSLTQDSDSTGSSLDSLLIDIDSSDFFTQADFGDIHGAFYARESANAQAYQQAT